MKADCGLWSLIQGRSHDFRLRGAEKLFTKLFTIDIPYASIQDVHGFTKSGKAIIEIKNSIINRTNGFDCAQHALFAYEPIFKHMSYIGISGKPFSFLASSYMETLLLLDLWNLIVYLDIDYGKSYICNNNVHCKTWSWEYAYTIFEAGKQGSIWRSMCI